MKKKELELLLQKTPVFDKPIPQLEQYQTPAEIAADIIFTAHQFGDIKHNVVVDLGCGTGIFSIGAYVTGAKKVVGIDIDERLITIAQDYADNNNLNITYLVRDIKDVDFKCDTVIMNPPFGAQKKNRRADRLFLEKGFTLAPVLYSLHLSKTIPFINQLVKALQGEITYSKEYMFPIKHVFMFHKKKVVKYEVTVLRIRT